MLVVYTRHDDATTRQHDTVLATARTRRYWRDRDYDYLGTSARTLAITRAHSWNITITLQYCTGITADQCTNWIHLIVHDNNATNSWSIVDCWQRIWKPRIVGILYPRCFWVFEKASIENWMYNMFLKGGSEKKLALNSHILNLVQELKCLIHRITLKWYKHRIVSTKLYF